MARIFHLVYHDVFRTGDGVFYLDDSPILGKNRKEYGNALEKALAPVIAYGRERDTRLFIHGLLDEHRERLTERIKSCPNIISEG
jgi:hypothetical protein